MKSLNGYLIIVLIERSGGRGISNDDGFDFRPKHLKIWVFLNTLGKTWFGNDEDGHCLKTCV